MESIEQQLEQRADKAKNNPIRCEMELFALLVRIRDVCVSSNIPMHLHGETALAAWRNHSLFVKPAVCIDVKDIWRFMQAIENEQDDRFRITGMPYEAHFPDFEFHIYNPDSIDYDVSRSYRFEHNCLHVRVIPVLHIPSSALRAAQAKSLIKARRIMNKGTTTKCCPWPIKRSDAFTIRVTRTMFKRLVRFYSGTGSSAQIANKTIDAHLVEDLAEVAINDELFCIPKEPQNYFQALFGSSWTNLTSEEYAWKPWRFRDAFHDWRSNASWFIGINSGDYSTRYNNLDRLNSEEKILRAQISKLYRIVDRTHYRYKLWSYYMPKKNYLLGLLEDGRYDDLGNELEEFFSKLEECRNNGLGLCFDRELFEAAMLVLENAGRPEYAAELKALVPAQHKTDIELPTSNNSELRHSTSQQELLLDMLKRLVAFFDDQQIRYYLLGGTCIGALRHEGFVPWDDDIDLLMDRTNFEKMVKAFADFPLQDFELCCSETSANWRRTFAQIAYTGNAAFANTTMYNRGLAAGTRIDVMILDDVRSNEILQYAKDLLLFQEVSIDALFYNKRLRNFASDYIRYKERQKKEGCEKVVQELRDRMVSHTKSESSKKVVRLWGRRLRVFEGDWFAGERFGWFESLKVRIPTRAEACLRLQYGYDWYMYPKKGRKAKHTFRYNWSVSGRTYQEDIERFVCIDDAERIAVNRKRLNVLRAVEKRKLGTMRETTKLRHLLIELRLEENCALLHDLFISRDYETFMRFIEPLADCRSKLHLVYPEFKQIPETVLEDWVAILVERGEYYNAYRLIEAFEASPDDLVPPLEPHSKQRRSLLRHVCKGKSSSIVWQGCTWRARMRIEPVLYLAEAYQDCDYNRLELAYRMLGWHSVESVPDVIFAVVALKKHGFVLDVSWDDVRLECERYLTKYPNNQEVRKALGDVLWETGHQVEAVDVFEDVYLKTLNGLDILDLRKRFGFAIRW